jgi:hypothetical protein
MNDPQGEEKMKSKLICITTLTLFAIVPAALANNWYVDGKHGNDNNNCKSRQHACKTISNALLLTLPGDSIFVAPATYHESNFFIPFELHIIGSDAKTTIVVGGNGGQGVVIGSEPKAKITISKMTFRGSTGLIDSGGGIYNCFGTLTVIDSIISGNRIRGGNGIFGYGGGIYNCPSSTLTLINTTVSDNSAEIGGAICNGGLLTIINSTFSRNEAHQRRGGGIANYGILTITNSTFSGNSSGSGGLAGGILNDGLFQSSGLLVIRNSTFAGNTAGFGGGAIFNVTGSAAGLENSIVSNNPGGNCLGTVFTKGYNLSSDDTCDFEGPGDLNNIAAKLGRLQDNGGLTDTMALLPESPAIDSGNPSGCPDANGHLLKTDQRGKPRHDKEDASGCDRGAYERQKD